MHNKVAPDPGSEFLYTLAVKLWQAQERDNGRGMNELGNK